MFRGETQEFALARHGELRPDHASRLVRFECRGEKRCHVGEMFASHSEAQIRAVIERIEAEGRGLTVGQRMLRDALAEWDCATRSLMDGINIIDRVHKRGAYIKVLDRPGLDLSTSTGARHPCAAVRPGRGGAPRILKRANEARVAAVKRGTKLGRNP